MSLKRSHYYITHAILMFREKDVSRTQHINFFFSLTDKKINLAVLADARAQMTNTLCQTREIQPEDVIDIIFGNISYLGHMSTKEFAAQPDAQGAPEIRLAANPYDA
jgi:hypothetical protein